MNNYTVLHLHTDLGNGGFVDSVVKYKQYIDRVKELGMTSIAFTEHGNVFGWYNKKTYANKAGLKYIHGIEIYVTESFDERVRDNYHCCLYAKNFEGFLEINKLSSMSYHRHEENRFFHNPRISMEELMGTSDNVIITTACIGGILGKGNAIVKDMFMAFMVKNRHRCFLEVQPSDVEEQRLHNDYMLNLHNKTGLLLTAGTDTHCLDESESRDVLQKSKKINFENESKWDLRLKSYEQLVEMFKVQGVLPKKDIYEALSNTNLIADMVTDFEIDYSHKYPHVCEDPESVVRHRIDEGLAYRNVKYNDVKERIEYELDTYIKNGALEMLLIDDSVKKYCRNNNIMYGYSRGSISGSYIAYLMQLTEIDSIKWNMSFERFMSPDRVSLADIDTDFPPSKREEIKDYLFNKSGFNCCQIITQNTIALKGAIRDVARAMNMDIDTSNAISKNVESDEDGMRKKYPTLFRMVDKLNGTIVSVGAHPCGILVTDYDVESYIGTFTTSSSEYPITQIDMKEIDSQNYVKLDILGLDNIELIQNTCDMIGVPQLTPDNMNFNDAAVWESVLKSSCMVFQWESSYAHKVYKDLFNMNVLDDIRRINPDITYIDLFSMGNGAIRPAGASYRDKLCRGEFNDNGHESLNNMLSDTLGFLIYQEQILDFLHTFCGFTKGKADTVRRGFAKKTGTEMYIPQIHDGFIQYMNSTYGENAIFYEELIGSFLTVIEDASEYLFSKNHSHPYSMIGYACAWLRHYYPLQFISCALDIYKDDVDKTSEIIEYATSNNIKINNVKFGKSRHGYYFDKEHNSIYKGILSIKYMNEECVKSIENMYSGSYTDFVDILNDLQNINSRQLDILIKLDFFDMFGNSKTLIKIVEAYSQLSKAKSIKKISIEDDILCKIISKYSNSKNKDGTESKSFKVLDNDSILSEYVKHIYSLEILDYTLVEKMKFQDEYMGYISPTHKESDRPILHVNSIKKLHRKSDGKHFGYSIIAQSLGSGKQSMFTIFNKDYNMCGHIEQGDVIVCLDYRRDKQYYTMVGYKIIKS